MSGKLGVIGDHDGVRAARRDKYAFNIRRVTFDLDLEFYVQISRRSLGLSYILRGVRTGFTDQKRHLTERGNHLFDHLQSLGDDIAADAGHSGEVLVVPDEACDEPCSNRIYGRYKYHRRSTRGVPRRQHGRRSGGDKDVQPASYQLGCDIWNLRRTFCQTVLDNEVLSFNKAPFAHSLAKAINERWRWWPDAQEADASHRPGLLRTRLDRPGHRAADETYELAPSH